MHVKGRGITFPSPVGLGSGLLTDGRGIDSIMEASGIDKESGLSTWIELGTCTPDKQKMRDSSKSGGRSIRVNLDAEKVIRQDLSAAPSLS